MLRSTLRQLVSISGRTILAIGLTSATVLALAPSAKADPTVSGGEMSVEVTAINNISYLQTVAPSMATLEGGTAGGNLTAQNNSGTSWTIRATSTNASLLKADASAQGSLGYKVSASKGSALGVAVTNVQLPVSGATTGGLLYTGTPAELGSVVIGVTIKTNDLFNSVKVGTYTDTITYIIANGS